MRQQFPLYTRKRTCAVHKLMSALGQNRTYAAHKPMSALPPKATAKADIRKRSCLLCPRKRTCAVQSEMSAKGHKRTFCDARALPKTFSRKNEMACVQAVGSNSLQRY